MTDHRPYRPNPDTDPSPFRRIRIPDGIWQAAWTRAESEGKSLHAVTRDLLRSYVNSPAQDHTDRQSP